MAGARLRSRKQGEAYHSSQAARRSIPLSTGGPLRDNGEGSGGHATGDKVMVNEEGSRINEQRFSLLSSLFSLLSSLFSLLSSPLSRTCALAFICDTCGIPGMNGAFSHVFDFCTAFPVRACFVCAAFCCPHVACTPPYPLTNASRVYALRFPCALVLHRRAQPLPPTVSERGERVCCRLLAAARAHRTSTESRSRGAAAAAHQ
jgi:hypothetical protein